MIKGFFNKLKEYTEDIDLSDGTPVKTESVDAVHKVCPECGGCGSEMLGMFICDECNGTGVVRKSFAEMRGLE